MVQRHCLLLRWPVAIVLFQRMSLCLPAFAFLHEMEFSALTDRQGKQSNNKNKTFKCASLCIVYLLQKAAFDVLILIVCLLLSSGGCG